jgi:hypothetical protein
MKMTRRSLRSTALLIIAAIVLIGMRVIAASDSRIVLDPGTVIPVSINTELTSNNSQNGDTFTATVDTSRAAYGKMMQGAVVDGYVKKAVPQSGNQPGTLDLAFTKLRLADGTNYTISGVPASLDSKDLSTDRNGVLIAKNTKKDEHLTYAGIGAGGGALIGLLSNGKLDLGKMLLGGALGYGAGSILKGPQQVHDVDLKPGTQMGVLLNKRVDYYHRTSNPLPKAQPGYKYYTYDGHNWAMNLATGQRTQID